MFVISSYQLKAARAMLDWSRKDVAEATGLDSNTIRNIEKGFISPRASTNNALNLVFEKAGLEFIEDDGVKRRRDQVKVHTCNSFFEDIIQIIKKDGGDVAISIKTQDALDCLFGASSANLFEHLQDLTNIARVKCLMPAILKPSFVMPSFQFRIVDHKAIQLPCFLYGNKYATLVPDNVSAHFAVFSISQAARDYHNEFASLWNNAREISSPKIP
jgi:transcriptional regulator with XRE-family HTH domain